MIKGTTKTGFKFTIDPDAVKNMEFLELVAEAEENGLLLPKMLERAIGKKQKAALYDHVRNDKGYVMLDDIKDEIQEIFAAMNTAVETKNS